MKKVLSILLATVMLLGTVNFTVSAEATSLPAAQDGIITLTDDVVLSSDLTMDLNEGNIIIDLGENTLSLTGNTNFYNGTFTIKNGIINVENVACTNGEGLVRLAPHSPDRFATLNLENITINADGYTAPCGLFCFENGEINLNNTIINAENINDGYGVFYSAPGDPKSLTITNSSEIYVTNGKKLFYGCNVEIDNSYINAQVEKDIFSGASANITNSTLNISANRAVFKDAGYSAPVTIFNSEVNIEGTLSEGVSNNSNPASTVIAADSTITGGGDAISSPEAKIGTTLYPTLTDALADAAAMNDAVTITLLDDVEWVTGAGHGSTPFVPAESSSVVTIDGNDFTITATGAGVGSIRAANGTLLTFNNVNFVDESVSYAEGAWEFTYLEFAGKLKFTNCDFKDEIQIDSDNNTSPITESEFTNCTFESNESSVYAVWFGNGSAKFDTCTFTGYRGLKMHEAYGSDINAITIENCTFNNITAKPAIAIGDLNALTEVNIKNCTVNNAQAGDQNAYLLETDTSVDTFTFVAQNNTITVDGTTITPMVKIGANEYPTIESAIAVATTNDVIDIFNNTTISDSDAATLAGKSVTIDLNEKELTINSATDYSGLISIPKNYKVNKTAVTDSVFTYSLKKVVMASPVGVVGGGGSSVSKPSTPEQDKTEETKEDTKLDEDAKTDEDTKTEESDANKEDSTTPNIEKTTNEIVLTLGDANINVFGNTIKNDVAPKLVNNRTMLPARLISESLGATVIWTAAEPNKVLIEKGDKVIIITIGSDIATVNGEEIKLDSPAFIENDRTYLPTRFLSEKLGATVEWVPETTQVIITATE